MNTVGVQLTSDLARAARALAQVSVETLAEAAVLTPQLVRGFERGQIPLDSDTVLRLQRALGEYGVLVIAEDEEFGAGVRKKHNSTKVRRLDNWENEGGPAYEDDI